MFHIKTELAAVQHDTWQCESLPDGWNDFGTIEKMIWLEDNATHCGDTVELTDDETAPDAAKVHVSQA